MKYALYTPNFGYFGDARVLADFAAEAEASGWDGFFLWDHLQFPDMEPAVDPWIALAAMAVNTERVAIGPMITPLPRRDLGKLARETASLDRLSGGRLIFGAGLGWAGIPEFAGFGHETQLKVRGEMLDEGLSILDKLWRGEAVEHAGEYYSVSCKPFSRPVQSPRIPVWIGGGWPSVKPFRRAAKWDGVIPMAKNELEGGTLSPQDIADVRRFIDEHRVGTTPYDVVRMGMTQSADDTEAVSAYADAGVTWWLESRGPWSGTKEEFVARLRNGPPRVRTF